MTFRFAMPFLFALTTVSMFALPSSAAVKTQEVKYTVGNTEYIGFLAVDDASKDKRPGVLVCPEWVGVNDYARGRAKQLAEMGYVAFVFDPYGGGKMAADVKQAGEWATALKNNRPELRARVNAAFATLKKHEQVDTAKTAAIGYCFGGTSALELARSGADLLGVVSFHGALATPTPAKAGELKAKVLVCHGAEDPFVPAQEVVGFEKEMREAKADWQLIKYANAVHSFTNPDAAKAGLPGVAYDEKADKRSWQAMKDFFAEIFGQQRQVSIAVPNAAGVVGVPRNPPANNAPDGRRIVFLCDASGSMINKFSSLKNELNKRISSLNETQSFNVIFFQDGRVQTFNKTGVVPATPDHKRKASGFLEEVTTTSTSTPIPGLTAAFQQQPDVIYLATDGDFAETAAVLKKIQEMNKAKKIRINTIALVNDKDTDAAFIKVLKSIANENGGTFRLIAENELQ